jgi:hypothetical protein
VPRARLELCRTQCSPRHSSAGTRESPGSPACWSAPVAGRRVRCWSPGTPGWARRAARVRSSVEALTDDAGAPPDVTVRLTTLALTAIADAAVGARLSGCPTTRRRPVTGRPSPPSSGTPDSGTWHGRGCCAATPVSHRARRAGPGSPAPRRSGRGPPVAGRGGPGEGGGRVRAQQRVRAGALPPALRRDPAGGRPARGGGRRGTRRPGDGRCDGAVGGPGDARVLESLGEARAKVAARAAERRSPGKRPWWSCGPPPRAGPRRPCPACRGVRRHGGGDRQAA